MQTHRPPTSARIDSQDTERTSKTNEALATGRKFMLTLRESVFKELQKTAEQRGVTIQGLIRAVIVPEWRLEHAPLIGKASAPSHSFSQDELARESATIQGWPKTKKTIEENIPSKVVA
jgi:hypothetical protein